MIKFHGAMHPRYAIRITRTRRSLWFRACRLLNIAWLHWEISSAEQWVQYAARDGVFDTANLREVQRAIEALRVKLAVWEAA